MYNREGEQMEKEEYKKISEVIYIIDRSRSMYGKEEEITESFNRWLAQQKQMKKEALVTLALCTALLQDAAEICEATGYLCLLYKRLQCLSGQCRRSFGSAVKAHAARGEIPAGCQSVPDHRRAG